MLGAAGTSSVVFPLTSCGILPPSCVEKIWIARLIHDFRNDPEVANMSADVHERTFRENASLFRYCEGNLSFSSSNDDDFNYNRKKMSRDPMSHRIIEKRRRDRMNNCLADLSRLIPAEFMKKGRGRIEKTEIIEMAIKHMKSLQEQTRKARSPNSSENSDNSVPSSPEVPRDPTIIINNQSVLIEHFRYGYFECLAEAMHYLVDVQGYFAGDALCVQMINHLHQHCDRFVRGDTLNSPNRQMGEGNNNASANVPAVRPMSNSPVSSPPGVPNVLAVRPMSNSPVSSPPGVPNVPAVRPMSNSPVSSPPGVPADDNIPNQNYEPGAIMRPEQLGFRPPRIFSERSQLQPKKHLEIESRSDVELQQNFALQCRTSENLREEPVRNFINPYVPGLNFEPVPFIQGGSGTPSSADESSHDTSSKDGSSNGSSQLREMLTGTPMGHISPLAKSSSDAKESTSPTSSNSSNSTSPTHGGPHKSCLIPKNLSFKTHSVTPAESHDVNPEIGDGSDNHHMMYKFKNNIKQRFSQESREIQDSDSSGELPPKKLKTDDLAKCTEPIDLDFKRRLRYASESDATDSGDISNRLSFGHKSSEKLNKKWEEPVPGLQQQSTPRLWSFSPQPSTSFFNTQPAICGKPIARQNSDSSFASVTMTGPEVTQGVPIFALHAKGSFYIPLTLDQASLAPFLTTLGITKTDEETEQNTTLHPVTISVSFQPSTSQSPTSTSS